MTAFLSLPHPADAAPMFIETDGIKVGYDKGFVLNVRDQFEMKFGAWLQFQHEYFNSDDDSVTEDISSFKVAKARLRWTGFMYSPKLGYVIQLELANPDRDKNGDKDVSLKDFAIDIKHYERAKVRIGQFKVPFNRQQMAFFGDLQFVDTSLTSKKFNANGVNARDIGIMMSGSQKDHLTEYFVGLFNGDGINNTTGKEDTQYLSVARVVFNPFGRMSISESDVDQTEKPLLSVGGGFAYDAGEDVGTFALEGAFKHKGKSIQGEYYFRDDDKGPDANGLYLQGGVFIVPEKIEVAARYAYFDPDGSNNDEEEITGGVNIFFAGHRRKLQIDVSAISMDANNTDDFRIRTQYQISF